MTKPAPNRNICLLFLVCVVMLVAGFRAGARLTPRTAAAPAKAPPTTAAGRG